jgi:hypothetical protein
MESMSVNVDRIKGTVVGFTSNLNSLDYPSKTPATIGKAKALELLLAPYRLELQYGYPPNTDYSTPGNLKPAKLVYLLTWQGDELGVYLDAIC